MAPSIFGLVPRGKQLYETIGNALSHESRRCGLCLFQLDKDAIVLEEPSVRRQGWAARTTYDSTVGSLDTLPDIPPDTQTLEFVTELRALDASAERGCVGCKAIWSQTKQQAEQRGFEVNEDCMEKELQLTWMIGDRGKSTKGLTVITWVHDEGKLARKHFRFLFEHRGDDYPHPAAVPLSEVAKEENTGSPASLQNLSSWLTECSASHATCKPPESKLPDRVLKFSKGLRGKISVRLVEGVPGNEPYAALSHRWGQATLSCRTTHETLAAHLESIPWTKLPKTFQQAVEVSLHLGLKYIWIDSLCIIQDSKEDWLVQSAKMCDIYQGSHITIAATNSTDSDDGLFRAVPKTPIDATEPRRAKIFIRDRPVEDDSGVEGHKEETPLLTRGWVFQERLLSKRMIHFAPREIVFECVKGNSRCDCGHSGNWAVRQTHFETLRNYMDLIGPDQIRNHWQDLVRLFCLLDLTFHSDMLPALAGIARQMGMAHKDTLGRYVAGMWEHTLLLDLVWVVHDGYVRNPRPEISQLPSWSWASKAGPQTWIRYRKLKEDLELVSFNIQLTGKDEYGPIDSAELTMRGFLAEGSWEPTTATDPQYPNQIDFRAKTGSTRTCSIKADYDISNSESTAFIEPGTPLHAMKTGIMSKAHLCLVLRAVEDRDGKRVFKRVGILDETPVDVVDSWFPEESEAETLILV